MRNATTLVQQFKSLLLASARNASIAREEGNFAGTSYATDLRSLLIAALRACAEEGSGTAMVAAESAMVMVRQLEPSLLFLADLPSTSEKSRSPTPNAGSSEHLPVPMRPEQQRGESEDGRLNQEEKVLGVRSYNLLLRCAAGLTDKAGTAAMQKGLDILQVPAFRAAGARINKLAAGESRPLWSQRRGCLCDDVRHDLLRDVD